MSSNELLVTAAVILMDGRLLLARRAGNRSLSGFWELPGGKVEIGESEADCLARELLEEFEISADVGEFIAESKHIQESTVICLRAYRVTPKSHTYVLHDHDAIAWIGPKDVEGLPIAPADVPLLSRIWPLLNAGS